MPKVDIDIQTDISGGDWQDNCHSIAQQTLRAAYIMAPPAECQNRLCEVSVLFCNDATMRQINKDWRGKDKSTNVLSFPQNDDIQNDDKPFCLGDIILAFETIQQEAGEKNIEFAAHLKHLIVHGFLHLVGYDHQNDAEAERMEAMEVEILNAANSNNTYAR